MLRVLCVAAIVSLVVGILKEGLEKGWMEGVSIWIAVFLVVAVGAGNNYMKEQQFAKLNAKRELRDVEVSKINFLLISRLLGEDKKETKFLCIFYINVDTLIFNLIFSTTK